MNNKYPKLKHLFRSAVPHWFILNGYIIRTTGFIETRRDGEKYFANYKNYPLKNTNIVPEYDTTYRIYIC